MWVLYVAVGLIVLFIVIEFFTVRYFFNYAVLHHPLDLNKVQNDNKIIDFSFLIKRIESAKEKLAVYESENVQIESDDGLTLRGVYYKAKEPNGIIIVFANGHNSSGQNDFSADAVFYLERGVSCLMPDQRACGKSDGKYITFGVRESEDIAKWCFFCEKNYKPEHIILHGISLGGATVIMAAGEKLPVCVHGIIDDCGFTSPYEQFEYLLRYQFKLPPVLVLPASEIYAKAKAHFSFKEKNTKEILKSCKLPVLFIHGKEDKYVPTYMSTENYNAAVCEKELLIIEGAKHAESIGKDEKSCREAIIRLVKRATGVQLYE